MLCSTILWDLILVSSFGPDSGAAFQPQSSVCKQLLASIAGDTEMDSLATDESESEPGKGWESDRSPDSGQATVWVEEDSFESQEYLHV